MIIDADICAVLQGFNKPLDLSEEGQALGAVREVGPGSHYLGAGHTLRNYETAFWKSTVADNNTYEQWASEGSPDTARRANGVWKAMLADYEAPAMDPGIHEALRDYRDRRLKEIGSGE